ncbi:MAG TPA: glycosyltransferase [Coriobacteriia bacterium]
MREDSTAPSTSGDAPSRPLRLLVVSHLYPSDGKRSWGVFVREQIGALGDAAEATLVVGRYTPRAGRAPAFPPANGRLVEVDLPWVRWLPSFLKVAWAVPAYYAGALRAARAQERPFDVVHAFYGFPDGVVGIMLGRKLGLPVVVTLLGADFNRQLARPGAGGIIGRLLSRARFIIGVSSGIVDGMRERFVLSERQVVRLPNGYNDSEIRVHAPRRAEYFLFVASLIPRKNPDVLLRAYAGIAAEVPLDLVIVGDGPMMGQLREMVRELGIGSRVRFEGERDHSELDGYLAKAAAYVLPSSSEGLAVAVNEALASGTPVIATDIPGTREQVTSEALGYLVPVGDAEALAEALLRAARTPWDHARIAAECGVLTWREHGRELLRIYREAAEGAG